MTGHKRTEITIETDSVMIIRRQRAMRSWCTECGCEVDIVSLAEGEAFTGMTGEALRDYAEGRGCHLWCGLDGKDLTCLESWLNSK